MCCGRLQQEVFCLGDALRGVCLSSHELLLPSSRQQSQPCPAKSPAVVRGASKAKRERGQDQGSKGSGYADLPLVLRAGQGRVLLPAAAGSGDTRPRVPAPRSLAGKGLGTVCRLLFAFSPPPLCFLCEVVSFGGERLALHRLRFPFVSEALSPFAP